MLSYRCLFCPRLLPALLIVSMSVQAVSTVMGDNIAVTKTYSPFPSEQEVAPEGQTQPYVDAVITLGKSISLKEVDSLPKAPGSRLEVYKRNNTVRVEIPLEIAELLVNHGIEVTVLREFMLLTDQRPKVIPGGPVQTALDASCSETSVARSNTNDLTIPEFDWALSTISMTDAPVDARVLCLDVYFEIDHSCVSDVEVDLSNEDGSITVNLKNESLEFSCSDYYEDTVTGITDFAGEPVNQDWYLWAADWFPIDRGVIDSWWIKLYYTTSADPNLDSNEPCSDTSVERSNTSDLLVPEFRWAFSTITVSEAPMEAQVLCLDVFFAIDHNCVGDVEVDLSNADVSIEADLKDASFDPNCTDYYEDTVTGITDFAGEPVNQDWHLWATDWLVDNNGVIDNWWIKLYYTTSDVNTASVPDEPHQAIALEDGVLYTGTTKGATGHSSSECSLNDTQDVWHIYSPNASGLLVLSSEGSELDTTLSVHDPCTLSELACNDDVGFFCGTGLWSQIMVPVVGGENYLIRVAGFGGSEGHYQVLAELHLDELPDEPNRPVPGDGQAEIATHTRLHWNEAAPDPIQSLPESGSAYSALSVIAPQTIYGNDDRVEEYDITDPDLLTAGDATVLITYKDDLAFDPDSRTYEMTTIETLAEWYINSTGYTICPDEPFRDQPSQGFCTGFLVAPDIIATAGHCIACPSDCNDSAFILGFSMVDESTPRTVFHESEVYFCREVIGFLDGWPDWALVRLDRPVVNVEPVPTRRTGKVADDQSLLMVGHPYGLPKKYDLGGSVGHNEPLSYFEANVDASGGSSGSGVFNVDTLEVEGILVAGIGSFDFGEKCDRSLALPDDFPVSDFITRATIFSSLIPSFDIYLGTDPDRLVKVADNVVTPHLNVTDLQTDTTYYWCVVARNIAGKTKGPVWTFKTEP